MGGINMIECFEIENFVICEMFRPYASNILPGEFQSIEYCVEQMCIEKKLVQNPEYIIELMEEYPETKRLIFERINRFGGVNFYRYLDMNCDVIQYVQSELPKYQITMQEKIKQLREMTGAGLMDCKKAIEESNGDINKSNKLLQENRWKYGKFIC